MSGSSIVASIFVIVAVVAQVVGSAVMPKTEGFTNALYTIICLIAFDLSFWACARLIVGGLGLSVVVPIIAAAVPLGSVAVGVLVYGESASSLKLIMLVTACCLVGTASRLN